MSLSNDYEIDILDHILGNTSHTPALNIYIALSTANPTDDGSGLAEPSGNGYARANHNSWNAASGRSISNDGEITFAQATGSWGTVSHFAIYDALTSGTMIGYGELTESKSIVSGNTARIADTACTVTVSAGGFSNYLANEILDHIFGNGAYTQPSTYVALSTANPTDAGTGAAEPSGNGYAREAISWDAASAGAADNTAIVNFDSPTGSWGTITHLAIYDALTAGNMLLYAAVTTSQAVGTSDPVSIAAGGVVVNLD